MMPAKAKDSSIDNGDLIKIKRVVVFYVGGTIGMKKNHEGTYVPVPNALLNKLKNNEQMHDPEAAEQYFGTTLKENELVLPPIDLNVIVYQLNEYDPLLDSSNMTTTDWIRIAKDIETNYNNFDGIVVIQGTDTLAYTSSVLSYMRSGLQKPVILTAAQISIFEVRSDARDHILSSIIFAACYDIPEVCTFFAGKLLRGNRIEKITSTDLEAFCSPNFHKLASVEINIVVYDEHIIKPQPGPFTVHTTLNSNVAILHFFPTMSVALLQSFFDYGLEGVVIRSYGAGNIPSKAELLDVIKNAVDRGIIVVNVTQCPQGIVGPIYEGGKALQDIGVILGADMTTEAAFTKLCFVLSLTDISLQEKITLMKTNLRGELTETRSYLDDLFHPLKC